MTRVSPATPQARRRARVAERIRQALDRLAADPSASLTAAGLAREAGIGRNALYTNHREMLDEMEALRAARSGPSNSDKTRTTTPAPTSELETIKALATQNAALLDRATKAESRAELLEQRNAHLNRMLKEMRAPVNLREDRPASER